MASVSFGCSPQAARPPHRRPWSAALALTGERRAGERLGLLGLGETIGERLWQRRAGAGPFCVGSRRVPPDHTMDWTARITTNPAQCGGRPCIRGVRIRVQDVLDLLASGLSRAEVVAELPDLEPADVEAALRYASARMDHPVLLSA